MIYFNIKYIVSLFCWYERDYTIVTWITSDDEILMILTMSTCPNLMMIFFVVQILFYQISSVKIRLPYNVNICNLLYLNSQILSNFYEAFLHVKLDIFLFLCWDAWTKFYEFHNISRPLFSTVTKSKPTEYHPKCSILCIELSCSKPIFT